MKMTNIVGLLIVILVVSVGVYFIYSGLETSNYDYKVESSVLNDLNSGNQSYDNVIVYVNSTTGNNILSVKNEIILSLTDSEFKVGTNLENRDWFAGELTKKGLDKLKSNKNVLRIEKDKVLALLDSSKEEVEFSYNLSIINLKEYSDFNDIIVEGNKVIVRQIYWTSGGCPQYNYSVSKNGSIIQLESTPIPPKKYFDPETGEEVGYSLCAGAQRTLAFEISMTLPDGIYTINFYPPSIIEEAIKEGVDPEREGMRKRFTVGIDKCEEDSDCTTVSLTYCGCGIASTETPIEQLLSSINKNYLDEWQNSLDNSGTNMVCASGANIEQGKRCNSYAPKCVSNKCELVKK